MGALGGLLGLGGTAPRGPILRAVFGYSAVRITPFNLAITVMTLAGALAGRGAGTPAALLRPILIEVLALVAGALLGLQLAARYPERLASFPVERWTVSALVVLGTCLIGVSTLPADVTGIPFGLAVRVPVGLALGLLIGLAGSVRDASCGELLVPVFVLAFGADIKIAGSAAACAGIPAAIVELLRRSRDARYVPEREYREIVLPIGAGSALGAVAGGQLAAKASSPLLMLVLGTVLIASAVRSFQEFERECLAN